MIEIKEGKIFVNDIKLTPQDINIIKTIFKGGKPLSAFDIMLMMGERYVQYIEARLRTLEKLYGIVVKPKRGLFEINPEIREELELKLSEVK